MIRGSSPPSFTSPSGLRVPGIWATLSTLVPLTACTTQGATEEDCARIFDRIVALELQEMGYADAALFERKQSDLRARHRHELASCVGKRIPEDALACAAKAKSTEELSHDCMK